MIHLPQLLQNLCLLPRHYWTSNGRLIHCHFYTPLMKKPVKGLLLQTDFWNLMCLFNCAGDDRQAALLLNHLDYYFRLHPCFQPVFSTAPWTDYFYISYMNIIF
jgi:hypothetical protein